MQGLLAAEEYVQMLIDVLTPILRIMRTRDSCVRKDRASTWHFITIIKLFLLIMMDFKTSIVAKSMKQKRERGDP